MKTDRKHRPIPGERKPFSPIPDFADSIVLLPDLGMSFAQAEKAVMHTPDASGLCHKAGGRELGESLVRAINITPPSSYADVAVKLRMMTGARQAQGLAEEHMVSLRQSFDFVALSGDAVAAQKIHDAVVRKMRVRRPLSPAVEAGLDAVSGCYAPGVDLDAYLSAIDAGLSHQDALSGAGGAGRM